MRSLRHVALLAFLTTPAIMVAGCGSRSALDIGTAIDTDIDAGGLDASPSFDASARVDARALVRDAQSPRDTGTPVVDAGVNVAVGEPIPFGEPFALPFSVARTPDGALVAYAGGDAAERRVVAVGVDGRALGPSRGVLAPAADNIVDDEEIGPSVAWGAGGGIVAVSDYPAGCRTQRIDARGNAVGVPSTPGIASCAYIGSTPSGWTTIADLSGVRASERAPQVVALDEVGAAIRSSSDLGDDAIDRVDRATRVDGAFWLSWYDTSPEVAGVLAYVDVQRFDELGVASSVRVRLDVVDRGLAPRRTHVATLETGIAVGWLTPTDPRISVALRDDAGASRAETFFVAPAIDGTIFDFDIIETGEHVLIVWWESRSGMDDRFVGAVYTVDGSMSVAPFEIVRAEALSHPALVETPNGALVLYAQLGPSGRTLTAQTLALR